MKVYCKCLNVELELDRVESRPKVFDEWAAVDEDCPPKCDHEIFQGLIHCLSINSQSDIVILGDDIDSRKSRSDMDQKSGSLKIRAYLPKLVLTHQRDRWRIRECFLCHTNVMAYFTNGSLIVCPDSLYGMDNDDELQKAQMSTSAQIWMLSKSALARDNQVSEEVRYSSQARKQLESMSNVWHIAKMRAKEEMHRRIDELRRQEEAAFEEAVRLSSELQTQVANSYLSLLTLRLSDPKSYVVEDKENEERATIRGIQRISERLEITGSHPGGDMPDPRDVFTLTSQHRQPQADVEVATDALDINEADLFDDDRDSPHLMSNEEWTTGRTVQSEQNDLDDKFDGDECLSTSAISSSMRAGRGMRASSRCVDDRLPDTDAFNAMTNAERAYAIERASYHCQDNRLHDLYGDMEPPHLQDLRRQAERARQFPEIDSDFSRHS